MAASAGAGGRGAEPGPPESPSRTAPSRGPCPRAVGAAPQDPGALGSSGPAPPGSQLPTPTHPAAAAPPALHGDRRRKGKETEAGTGAAAEGPGAAWRAPRSGRPLGPLRCGAAADAGSDTPGCGQPATLRRSPSCLELPAAEGQASGVKGPRGARSPRSRGCCGGGPRGAYLSWCSRARRRPPQPQVGDWRSQAPRGSAASKEARLEPSVRRESSYSGRHVAAHAPGARWYPPRRAGGWGEAAPGLRDPGHHQTLPPLGLGSGSTSPARLVPVLIPWGTCLGPLASVSHMNQACGGGFGGGVWHHWDRNPKEIALGNLTKQTRTPHQSS